MTSLDRDTEVWVLPVLSQEFERGPVIEIARERVELRYDYETATGAYEWEAIVFDGVAAALFTADHACSEAQVAAYDRLVDISPSDWIRSLPFDGTRPAKSLRHLRIYFDDIGCFDVAATSFTPPPPRVTA